MYYSSTSIAGLCGDRRPITLGLLSFGVLLSGFGNETESTSAVPEVLSFRAVFAVDGDVLCVTSTEAVLQPKTCEKANEIVKQAHTRDEPSAE